MSVALLITDIDNTLFNWIDYFAPVFRGMIHALSRETSYEEEVLIAAFRDLYHQHGSVEYAFAIQEIDLFSTLPQEQVQKLIRLTKSVASRIREANGHPYPGVRETLDWISKRGILIVAATNSPEFQAIQRLRKLRLLKYFHGIAAWKGHEIPEKDIYVEQIRAKRDLGHYKCIVPHIMTFPEECLKPSVVMYQQIINLLKIPAKQTWVVGDSLLKDVKPAMDIGAHGIWARYGTYRDQRNFETLLSITTWGKEKIASTYDETSVEPEAVIDCFADLKRVLPIPQPELPLF